jgi:NitT/TauT family transport system substrate-binding protein
MLKSLTLLVGLAAVSATSLASAETLKVAVAQRGFWNSTLVDIATKQGYFKDANLEIEVIYTQGGASTLQPMITGNVDIAMSNGILGVIAAYSKGMPVRIISPEGTGASEAFWYARADSGIKSLKDLDGKTIAFSSPGSSTNLILLQLLAQAKVNAKMVPTGGAPATLTQVMTKQIDAGWSVPPFVLRQRAEGQVVIIARGGDVKALADQTIRVNVANVNALNSKREAMTRYLKALSRAIDWAYSDPHAIENYAEIAKVPVELSRQTRDEFFPKQGMQLTEVKGLDLTLKQAHEFKYTTTDLTPKDVAGLFDLLLK